MGFRSFFDNTWFLYMLSMTTSLPIRAVISHGYLMALVESSYTCVRWLFGRWRVLWYGSKRAWVSFVYLFGLFALLLLLLFVSIVVHLHWKVFGRNRMGLSLSCHRASCHTCTCRTIVIHNLSFYALHTCETLSSFLHGRARTSILRSSRDPSHAYVR